MLPEDEKPEDLGNAIAAIEMELKRLGLHKKSIHVVLWLEWNGFGGRFENICDRPGFVALYRFLKKCEPDVKPWEVI